MNDEQMDWAETRFRIQRVKVDGRLARWTENVHYTRNNTLYGKTPNRKQTLRKTTVGLTLCHCLRAEFAYRDRQKGEEEKKKNENKIKRSDEICEKQTNLRS